MESSPFERTAELPDKEDKRMDSLARSDSGKDKSLDSVDFPDDNVSPDEANNLESTKEIDDSLQNAIFDSSMTGNKNASPNCESTFSHDCTHPDSGIEHSPLSQHFPFSNSYSNDLQQSNSQDVMSFRKQRKDMIEGHSVADLADVNKGRSEKLSLKRQALIDIPPGCSLHFSSFENEKPMYEPYSYSRNQSPEVSLPSSTDSEGNCCDPGNIASTPAFVNAAHKIQAQNGVRGYNKHGYATNPHPVGIQNGCGQLLTSTPPEAVNFVCRMLSPQGMVPRSILDNALKELASAKKKISELESDKSELESDNLQIYKDYALLARKNMEMCENGQLQLQRLTGLHNDVDYLKNKYSETKKQLETELQTKHELNLKHAEHQEAAKHELEVKDREIEDLRKKCQALRFRNEGLESKGSKDVWEVSRQLEGVVHMRPVTNNLDDTQVKRIN